MYIIGTTKSKFIRNKFFEVSFRGDGDDKADRSDFEKLKTSAELHYLASIFNWDDDLNVLDWIISSPMCDKATALLIFWRAQPADYTEFENENEVESFGVDAYRIVKKIINNVQTGFYKRSRIRFNPNSDEFDIHWINKKAKWTIPDQMKKGIIGLPVVSIEETTNVINLIATAIWGKLRRSFKRLKKRVMS
ncbi:MAG: DUF4274 domain-containing protein [Cytophagales bacterium]|jgi:hypothetical protein|nr:DUF4274 domain-containing protein [Cytophagales bacterium]